MIWTVVQTSWRRLKNNRSEMVLTFVVPILFFSIFALIFGSRDSSSSTPKIKIAICDESGSSLTQRAIDELQQQKSLRITQDVDEAGTLKQIDRAETEELVRRGMVSAAVVFSKSSNQTDAPKIEVLTDSFDQVASQVLVAVVQKSVFTAQSKAIPTPGSLGFLPTGSLPNGSPPTGAGTVGTRTGDVIPASYTPAAATAFGTSTPSGMPVIESVDLIGGNKTNPVIAMYAAGIAVMFLLFSATTASGSLLEERENSTLDRLLCSRLTMDQLLLGKWAYLTIVGCIQMFLMFLWGSIVFRIELWRHFDGFAAMTLVTAGAASSFALLLASLCKSRTQLGWMSTIVILSMSALGGSMVPRYLMSESMQRVGLATFNAWALEGYNKVFWRELSLEEIGLELGVLTGCAAVFIVLARLFAVRWERS
ncbi:ABC-2 family transporter protein [Pirellula sp. SH-Sr6A]|uniref:ABC transporter permease n=1 Tax=Pirellula sp. SH-Sr6A TaxID=1632865 RepID=UPI00078D78E9|nr:ABC transporter permease [Pirellula sp. SH-Sr6A]AMV33189.1 ABC-2 family transporter protein [Pirellula sp. SH-Sr6A]